MKYLPILLFLFLGLSATAQRQADVIGGLDTLTASQSVTYTLVAVINEPGSIAFGVSGLKISGNPAGTISYQAALDDAGTFWYTMATDTITDGTTDAGYEATNFAGKRARIVIAADGTTQSAQYRGAISFKRL